MPNGDTIYLPEIEINVINKYEPQTFGGGGLDSDFSHSHTGQLINVATRTYILNTYPPLISQNVRDQEAAFAANLQSMPAAIAQSINSLEQSAVSSESGVEKFEKHIHSIDTLIVQKTQTYTAQKEIADKYYYGHDFFGYPASRFITDAISGSKTNYPPDKNYKEWYASLAAAYAAKYSSREIDYLNALKQKLQEPIRLVNEAREKVRLNQYPIAPPGVWLDGNLQETKAQDSYYPSSGSAFMYTWFYMKVRNKGPWDYKQQGRQYADFGNFNYGAVGTAAGIPEQVLLRGAGAAQTVAGTSSTEFGEWWAGAPYGDDPVDQVWIKFGIDYAKSKGY
ncbi:hypothetical protein C4J85_2959 [Pseudomonas sp. R4-34-07]|uniref:polymorphic toxin type 44 domain-containing protein n=1 Tax=Pseudomonas sp. R4-34-07 TaxID=658642 RepID=UPI000F6E90F4|nr:polymorphic toxin type 44 domain-containing protein [Pseudomonas sp. R4-34-07]AZF53443.1 hypothetical protein C4J85_2959 [Pseudomonas sp. R4-34-07]